MALKFWLTGIRELQKLPLSLLHIASTDCLGSVLSLLSPHPGCGPCTLHTSRESMLGLCLVNNILYQSSAFRIIGHRFPLQGSVYSPVCFCLLCTVSRIYAGREVSKVARSTALKPILSYGNSLLALVFHSDICNLTNGTSPE